MQMEMVRERDQQMRHADTEAAEEHQRAAADSIDQCHGKQRKQQVDRPGDNDVEQNISNSIAGIAVDLLRVIKQDVDAAPLDRKSTRLNSSHLGISYAVFCLKKK